MSADSARAPAPDVDAAAVREYLLGLQRRIVAGLEAIDGQSFRTDAWQRPEGGGGITRVIEEGGVFERGAVLFSHVRGAQLPASASAHRAELAGRACEAVGVSLVIHPRNPYVPTVHLNVRFFVAPGGASVDPVWWFGGGMDLTPFYPFEKDVVRFHSVCRQALEPFGAGWHPRFKKWCDDYFFLKHRNEPRGVGGIFYDNLDTGDFARDFTFTCDVGLAFLDVYPRLVRRHLAEPWTDADRRHQLERRGRYVEFNLLYDRGTKFGLMTGGNVEAILMSLPPEAAWP